MGDPTTMRTYVLLLAIAACALGLPSDDTVPETQLEHVHSTEDTDSFAAAEESVRSMMASGKTSDECKKLADASKKEVEDSVKKLQGVLDKLPDGSKCHDKGQDAVKSTKDAKTKADDDLKDANKKFEAAKSAPVDFGKRPYESLTEGDCATLFNSQNYKDAKSTFNSAKTKKEKAEGAAAEAKKAHDAAVQAAKEMKHECLCEV